MPGDYSLRRFDKTKNYGPLLTQQGRVQLDSDWNEFMDALDRRFRAETLDIFGQSAVPTGPDGKSVDGFKIAFTNPATNVFTIGPGRIYVDGLLAENHGASPTVFDPTLAELRGTGPVPYDQQPYYRNAPALPKEGPYLVYLDVWQREVTYLEAPCMIEPAVGLDTTARLQTVWQVKVSSQYSSCKDFKAPQPSAGRLTTKALSTTGKDDPCIIPPSGGYTGLENHLYRVEIHDGGKPGKATFKWSRDNASFGTSVTNISSSQITVAQLGRDSVVRFKYGDWVEILDDYTEWSGLSGQMVQITNHPDDSDLTIALSQAPTGFATKKDDLAARHTRIRKWDQSGAVRKADGTAVTDLSAPTSGGVIHIAAAPSAEFVLEDGVTVSFSLDPSRGGEFNAGDYWVFAARTAGAWLEPLTEAPPRGIHHHYTPLAVVTNPQTDPADCRTQWPPASADGCCDCTICVTPESHANDDGSLTLGTAIQNLITAGGGTVCLARGIYPLAKVLNIQGASSIRIKGQGWNTVLAPNPNVSAAFLIDSSADVTIENLTIAPPPQNSVTIDVDPSTAPPVAADNQIGGIAIANSMFVTVRHCSFTLAADTTSPSDSFAQNRWPIAVSLSGFLNEIKLHDNFIVGDKGVAQFQPAKPQDPSSVVIEVFVKPPVTLFTAGLYVESNLFWCAAAAIDIEAQCYLTAETSFSRNTIYGCQIAGISVAAQVIGPLQIQSIVSSAKAPPQDETLGNFLQAASDSAITSRLEVMSNVLCLTGDGIVVGCDETRVEGNDISPLGAALQRLLTTQASDDGSTATTGTVGNGIVLQGKQPLNHCQVIGNRITGMTRHGVFIQTPLASAMFKQNIIENVGEAGITMILPDGDPTGPEPAGNISIENNQCLKMHPQSIMNTPGVIRVTNADNVAIDSNIITWTDKAVSRYSVCCEGCNNIRISENQITDATTADQGIIKYGIYVDLPFVRLDVDGNTVVLSAPSGDPVSIAIGLLVGKYLGSENTMAPRLLRRPSKNIKVNSVGNFGRDSQVFVGVQGNHFETGFFGATVEGVDVCAFTNNRCVVPPQASELAVGVVIMAGAIIASGNFVQSPSRESMRLTTTTPPSNVVPAAVLGNIVTGDISLNGQPVKTTQAAYATNVVIPSI